MEKKKFNRRQFLAMAAASSAGLFIAACEPQVVEVEKIVTQQVEVEVEKVITKEVEVEVEVEKIVQAPPEVEEVTLNFFNRGGEYIEMVMGEQMKLFKELRPDISFELNAVAGYSHQEALLMMLAAGTGPDVWFDSIRTTGMLTRKGVTMDLEPFLAADPNFNEDDFIDLAFVCQMVDGKRYGLPWDSGALALFYNKELFDKAGIDYPDPTKWMTWTDVIELGRQLTLDMNDKTPNDTGFDPNRVKQYGFYPDTGHGRQTYIWSNGGEIMETDLSCPCDTPEFIEAMNWLADAGLVHYISPSEKFQQAGEIDLRSGNVAMQHTGVWEVGTYVDAGIDFGVVQVPYSKKQVSYMQYSPLCVFRETKYPQQSYDFAFFSSASHDGEKILVDLGVQQPIRKDLTDTFITNPLPPDKASRQVFYDVFDKQYLRWPGDKLGSFFNGWYQYVIDLWSPYLSELFGGRKRWEDMAAEVRTKTEYLYQTGEIT